MSPIEIVHLALGSNLGDRAANLAEARLQLCDFVEELECSGIYETPPWGVLDQPRFLNQVVKGKVTLSPLRLLARLKEIEAKMGRQESVRYGPRLIDLDILLYGQLVVKYERLQIPHPGMLERAFVLVPLAELSPGLVIPGTAAKVEEWLEKVDPTGINKYKDPDGEC